MSNTEQKDDLTPEEIKAIEEFRNADDLQEKSLQELLDELHKQ